MFFAEVTVPERVPDAVAARYLDDRISIAAESAWQRATYWMRAARIDATLPASKFFQRFSPRFATSFRQPYSRFGTFQRPVLRSKLSRSTGPLAVRVDRR